MEGLRTLIVYNQKGYHKTIEEELQNYAKFEVLKVAFSYEQAFLMIREITPHIVILRSDYFDKNSLNLTRKTYSDSQGIKYIFIGRVKLHELVNEGLKYNVFGWIMEDITVEDLVVIVNIIHNGGIIVHSKEVGCISINKIKNISNYNLKQPEIITKGYEKRLIDIGLTDREIEVLTLVAEGATNKEISMMLYISENTVKTHVRNILGKLQFNSRARAARYAIELGCGVSKRIYKNSS